MLSTACFTCLQWRLFGALTAKHGSPRRLQDIPGDQGHPDRVAPGLRQQLRSRQKSPAASHSCKDRGRIIQSIAMTFSRITIDPTRMAGVPCIRNLRIPVATVIDMVADGMSEAEILRAYPDLESADIKEALHFAEAVRERELPLVSER